MEHTRQPHYVPRLEALNLDSGDVALCGAYMDGTSISGVLDEHRAVFVAPLDSRADLERLLRGLHRYPQVRHLVLFGDDPNVAAEGLLALWRDGLDDGRMPGGRGHLCAGLDADAVDALRGSVELHDLRGATPDDIAGRIPGLPAVAAGREARTLPEPEVSRRKVFPSRKTSFPIFSRDVGDAWLQLLNLALKIGSDRETVEGERFARVLNTIVTIGLPVIAEDLEVEENPLAESFPSILDFNRADFERYLRRFEPGDTDGNERRSLDYGDRLYALGGLDQVQAVCERLRDADSAGTETAVMLQPADFGGAAVLPNTISASFSLESGALYGSFVLRRSDVYTHWPLEALALIRLQQAVADRLGVEAGPATFVLHSIELYDRDWGRATALLDEHFKRPLPLQVDHSGVFLFGNDGGKARGMLLDHEAATIFWEDAFDTAQELSWYIVDAMPWILPQHIRYVGQESSTLGHAMQVKECYLQG